MDYFIVGCDVYKGFLVVFFPGSLILFEVLFC